METPKRRKPPAVKVGPETRSSSRRVVDNRTKEERDVHEENSTCPSESIINPAHISVGGAVTKNLENYESAKVSVMITRPCFDTQAERDRVLEECSTWVNDTLIGEIEAL